MSAIASECATPPSETEAFPRAVSIAVAAAPAASPGSFCSRRRREQAAARTARWRQLAEDLGLSAIDPHTLRSCGA